MSLQDKTCVVQRGIEPGIEMDAMSSYVQKVYRCRYFWLSLVKLDLDRRYQRSLIGVGWSLLNPIAMAAVLCAVFSTLFKQDISEYGPFLITGIVIWAYLSTTIQDGCLTFRQAESYIRHNNAPLAIYGLRVCLGAFFHLLAGLSVAIAARWILLGFDGFAGLLALVPAVTLLLIIGWAFAILFGFLNVYFADTQHMSSVALQMLYFATPILYPPEMLKSRGVGIVLQLNPFSSLIAIVRDPIMTGEFSFSYHWFVAIGMTVAVTGMAIVTLVRYERKLVFEL